MAWLAPGGKSDLTNDSDEWYLAQVGGWLGGLAGGLGIGLVGLLYMVFSALVCERELANGPVFVLPGMLLTVVQFGLVIVPVALLSGLPFSLDIVLLAVLFFGLMAGVSYEDSNYYYYRFCWFWWRRRPHPFVLEAALQKACAERPDVRKVWTEPLRRLEEGKKQADSPGQLISTLQSQDWVSVSPLVTL